MFGEHANGVLCVTRGMNYPRIWWRQLVPSAMMIASGALRTAGNWATAKTLRHLHRDHRNASIIAARARHAAAGAFNQRRFGVGDQSKNCHRGDISPNVFWWQWPCTSIGAVAGLRVTQRVEVCLFASRSRKVSMSARRGWLPCRLPRQAVSPEFHRVT